MAGETDKKNKIGMLFFQGDDKFHGEYISLPHENDSAFYINIL
jgi:hypothetical protein